MHESDDQAQQIERFHAYASCTRDDLEECFSSELAAWLRDFVRKELADCNLPAIDTAKDFADAVQTLSVNKRRWAQVLGDLVIEVSDDRVGVREANAKLKDFMQQCPWHYLRISAARKLF